MRKYEDFEHWKSTVAEGDAAQDSVIKQKLAFTFLVYGFLTAFVISLFIFEIKRYKSTKLKTILLMIIYNLALIIAMALDFFIIILFVFPKDLSGLKTDPENKDK
jgi:cellulose synthase/poly-beta-1,6-N-acetylglucosamine synthase-like glycosyltransferase